MIIVRFVFVQESYQGDSYLFIAINPIVFFDSNAKQEPKILSVASDSALQLCTCLNYADNVDFITFRTSFSHSSGEKSPLASASYPSDFLHTRSI